MQIIDQRGVRIKGVMNRESDVTADRHVRIWADNLSEVERWLEDTPKVWGQQSSHSNPKSKAWDLNVGYEGAKRLAKDGWSEGARDLDHRLQAIIPTAGREARWGYSVAGYQPSVGRYLAGNPANMKTRTKRQSGQSPVLHLCLNTVASCMINGDQMANYGTALVGLIDRLEQTGRRIQLDVCFVVQCGSSGRNNRLVCGWNVKRASEAVDLAAVAFAIAHPAAFRRLGFAMMERSPAECEDYGYGRCLDAMAGDMIDPEPGVMVLDGVNHEPHRCNSPEDALRMAVEQLNKAAVLAGHATVDSPLIEEDI